MSKRHKARTTMTEPVVDSLADMVADLVNPIQHYEPRGYQKRNPDNTVTWMREPHHSTHESLIDQLRHAVEASASTEAGDGPRPGFGSKPAARLEALDAFVRIDQGAAAWVADLGGEVPTVADKWGLPSVDTKACVRRLHGLAAASSSRRDVERDVKAWWTSARVLTGWDSPAWKPDNTCPVCEVKGGLRIRLALRSAVCVECHSTWDEATIGLLADHIRAEAEAAGGLRVASAVWVGRPCRCGVCAPEYRFWRLCPSCGHVEGACAKPSDHRFPCTGPVV